MSMSKYLFIAISQYREQKCLVCNDLSKRESLKMHSDYYTVTFVETIITIIVDTIFATSVSQLFLSRFFKNIPVMKIPIWFNSLSQISILGLTLKSQNRNNCNCGSDALPNFKPDMNCSKWKEENVDGMLNCNSHQMAWPGLNKYSFLPINLFQCFDLNLL